MDFKKCKRFSQHFDGTTKVESIMLIAFNAINVCNVASNLEPHTSMHGCKYL